ncbi:MAG: ribosome silencing factor [Aeromonadales bacterium]|nr:ribosome silencing factor [Aeromonadales bacterium]
MNKQDLIEKCIKTLEDAKAHDLVNIEVGANSSLADNMLICTGTSNRHVSAIAGRLVDNLYKDGLKNIKTSGEQVGEWVIVDTGEVMVHIMQDEVRHRYELDDLYRCIAAGGIE